LSVEAVQFNVKEFVVMLLVVRFVGAVGFWVSVAGGFGESLPLQQETKNIVIVKNAIRNLK
jgi:hypothetical protein